MSDFVARLFNEHDELHQRIEKLRTFIVTEAFDKLPEVDRTDLKEQLRHMEGYFIVVSRRLSRQGGEIRY